MVKKVGRRCRIDPHIPPLCRRALCQCATKAWWTWGGKFRYIKELSSKADGTAAKFHPVYPRTFLPSAHSLTSGGAYSWNTSKRIGERLLRKQLLLVADLSLIDAFRCISEAYVATCQNPPTRDSKCLSFNIKKKTFYIIRLTNISLK